MAIDRRRFIKLTSLTSLGLPMASLANAGTGLDLSETFSTDDQPIAHSAIAGLPKLAKGFINPPKEARPSCYWWWFNNLVNKAGITRDLEEFRDKGMGGVLLICSANGYGGGHIPSGPAFLSAEWRELFKHSLKEANRLGLEVGVNLCGGWAMGGPWIKPEFSGRWFLQSQLSVTGPQKFSEKLPLPGNRSGYDNAHAFNVPSYVNLPLEKVDYRDTAVVAFKSRGNDSQIDAEQKKVLAAKTNRLDSQSFTRATDVMGPPLVPWKNTPDDQPIPTSEVIDLTDKLKPDGTLDWDIPAGNYTIIRTGHRMTGARTVLALPEADGLEVDWLNEAGVEQQFEHFGNILLADAGPLVGKTLKYFHDDSFEDGYPNWTSNILEKFKKYRGYDATPYLPVFAGHLIGSAEIADRFLHDYRKTVADCMADAHYGRFAELCHAQGMQVQNEAGGPNWSATMCMDGLKNLGRSDRPMGEFWQDGAYIEDDQNKVNKMVSSAAHIYGKKLVSAEGFTSFRPHWSESPEVLKPTADRAFCEGINRIVVHTSTATRPEDGKPGYEYAAGTHFNPNITWWHKSGAFLNYLSRCQYILQQGNYVADVLFYNGDWAPNIVPAKHINPGLGKGYEYDVCNEEVLLTRLSVKNNFLVLPDGMRYRLLVLPETNRMPVAVARKIKELVQAGATVVGPKPNQDPGLNNYPACDAEVNNIAGEVWGNVNGKDITLHNFGKGRIFRGVKLRQILTQDGINPDFTYSDQNAFIDFIHRTTEEAEIYFLANRLKKPASLICSFRVTGRQPELWDPVTAERKPLLNYMQQNGQTAIPLEFIPEQAYFIFFRKPGLFAKKLKPDVRKANFNKLNPIQELSGSWNIQFDTAWGGPATVVFDKLEDWSKRPEKEIKYYSGTAVYQKRFDLEKPINKGENLFLDLGEVKNIAEVKLNGKSLGIIWTSPWRVDISEVVKQQDNLLEVDVVDLWPNRLIGDAALPENQRLTKTNVVFKPDMPLLPSGLLGPVTIQVAS